MKYESRVAYECPAINENFAINIVKQFLIAIEQSVVELKYVLCIQPIVSHLEILLVVVYIIDERRVLFQFFRR